jgi:hypothetical protein
MVMAKKKPTFARTSVSLPIDLRKRMDKVGESVNWSLVAVRAFEQELGRIASQKKEKNMSDVISRLRASKNKSNGERFEAGKELGVKWARETAEAEELELLSEHHDAMQRENYDIFAPSAFNDAYGMWESLFFHIHRDDDGDRQACEEFWDVAVGEENRPHLSNGEFLRGFVDGALEVWDEVKNQI